MTQLIAKLARFVFTGVVLAGLSACTNGVPTSAGVAEAFESTGTVNVQPYTRTIFSTGNF